LVTDGATYSILLVDADDTFVGDAQGLLDGHKVYSARNISDAQRKLVEEGIDIAIVGPTYAHEAGVAESSLLFDVQPDLPVLLAAEQVDTVVLRAALRAGMKDVIEMPLTLPKLAEALGFIDQLQRAAEQKSTKKTIGKVVTIMSPKGGAGKTMTTTNVALTLAGWHDPGRVVVLDAGLQFGDVCISLQVDLPETSKRWTRTCSTRCWQPTPPGCG